MPIILYKYPDRTALTSLLGWRLHVHVVGVLSEQGVEALGRRHLVPPLVGHCGRVPSKVTNIFKVKISDIYHWYRPRDVDRSLLGFFSLGFWAHRFESRYWLLDISRLD